MSRLDLLISLATRARWLGPVDLRAIEAQRLKEAGR